MIKELYRNGVSISDIARRTGRDRKTIRRILQRPLKATPTLRRPRKRRARKLDPYIPYLEQRIQDGVLNAEKRFTEIQAKGYPGGRSQGKAFVQPFRQRQPTVTVRLETAPGEQAQVDWGHFGFLAQDGRQRRLYGFVMTLGWSRAMYLEFTVSADIAWFLRCHLHAFRYFGGMPRHLLYDNLKSVVLDRDPDGTMHWNPRYLDFADLLGLTPRVCQPYRAQTTGKVESGIKYVRYNFWPGLHFTKLFHRGDTEALAAERKEATPAHPKSPKTDLVPVGEMLAYIRERDGRLEDMQRQLTEAAATIGYLRGQLEAAHERIKQLEAPRDTPAEPMPQRPVESVRPGEERMPFWKRWLLRRTS